jgi:hypothetical protein
LGRGPTDWRRARGAALVEVAIVVPIVLAVLFVILDFGIVFRDQLTLEDAVNDAARAGSIMGPDTTVEGANGDYEVISTLREGLGSIDPGAIERIVVFKGSEPDGDSPESQVPTACKDGTPAPGDVCNVYPVQDAFLAAQEGDVAYFNCPANPGSPACSWIPEDRDDGPDPAEIEYLGVWVKLRTDRFIGLAGPSYVERAAVVRLEPGEVDV